MLVSRDAMRTFGWILALTLSMAGCQSAPEQITSKDVSDDFGEVLPNQEEITVESVQSKEMLHQRAQAEFRLGPAFAFDLFDPGRDPHTDVGILGGGKLQLETAKNIYMGLSVDWTDAVVEQNTAGLGEQIFAVKGYDRLSVLGTIDYDIPINDNPDGLILRLGMGVGMCFVDFNSAPNFANDTIEDIYQIMFRPSIGLRYPVSEHLLLFSELTYDIVPEKTMATRGDFQTSQGPRAILSAGTVLFGVSYQW
ncbi:MAG: hypothetical protein VX288_01680 [Planctomycetota bacterium]|nr:hypothetical protein [Planctomycetota bacterium]